MRNRAALIAAVEAALASSDSEELLEHLGRAGVPAGKVRTLEEVYAWEQVESQGLKVQVDHARLGRVTLPGPPLRFFAMDQTETTKTRHSAPPVLDADGETIRRWLSGTGEGVPIHERRGNHDER